MLRQGIGPPKYALPWYSAPPYHGGEAVDTGGFAGDLWGPAFDIIAFVREVGRGRHRTTGFTPVNMEHPAFGLDPGVDQYVWVNLWCSDDKEGRPNGYTYAE